MIRKKSIVFYMLACFLAIAFVFCDSPGYAQDALVPQVDTQVEVQAVPPSSDDEKIEATPIVEQGATAAAVADQGDDVAIDGSGNINDTQPGKSIYSNLFKQRYTKIKPEMITSPFFTYWQYQAILNFKKSRGKTPPSMKGVPGFEDPDQEVKDLVAKPKPLPEERYLSLGGILFVSSENWIVWLNGKRLTPTEIPREIIDIEVFKDYVELKWMDEYTNQIFPMRLRPHQRFHLDSRIFLPG